MQTAQRTINKIDNHIGIIGVALTALRWNTEDTRKKLSLIHTDAADE